MPNTSPEGDTDKRQYRITVRFGDEILEAGHTAIPNLALNCYAQLGVSPAEMMFTIHVWQYWWTEKEPYPSLQAIADKMHITRRQVRNYAQSLKGKGLLRVHERYVPGLGQVTSEYDYSLFIQRVVALAQGAGGTPRKKPSEGGRKESSEGPRNSPSSEEYPGQEDSKQQDVGVVTRDALEKFGITKAVASKLAGGYPAPYIFTKLDLVQWLVDTRSSLVGKNPAGYLRRAIEEDYAAPPTYKSPDQRKADVDGRDQAERAEKEHRREAEADYARVKVLDQQKLAEQYPPQPIPGTTLTTHQAWEQTLDQLHTQVTRPNFEMWLRPTTLVSCDGQHAVVATPSRYHADTLAGRLTALVQHALSTVLATPVHCQYVPVPELLDAEAVSTNGQTAPTAQHSTGGQSAAVSP